MEKFFKKKDADLGSHESALVGKYPVVGVAVLIVQCETSRSGDLPESRSVAHELPLLSGFPCR